MSLLLPSAPCAVEKSSILISSWGRMKFAGGKVLWKSIPTNDIHWSFLFSYFLKILGD